MYVQLVPEDEMLNNSFGIHIDLRRLCSNDSSSRYMASQVVPSIDAILLNVTSQLGMTKCLPEKQTMQLTLDSG